MYTLQRQSFLLSWNINLSTNSTNYNWLIMIYVLCPFSITCVWYPTFFKLLMIKWRNWFSESLQLWRWKNKRQPFLSRLKMRGKTSGFALWKLQSRLQKNPPLSFKIGMCKPRNAFQQTTQNDQIHCVVYYANAISSFTWNSLTQFLHAGKMRKFSGEVEKDTSS